MRLKVTGVETVEITDPNKLCGHRKRLDKNLLQRLKGQDFTAAELKQMFGYAKNTALCDTQLTHHIASVKNIGWKGYPNSISRSEEKATLWRVK